jgi:hypothetical protein
MRHKNECGTSSIEFAFLLLVLVPLLLGTGVTGANMIRSQQAIQLARDAGHMYARGLDFSQAGNKTVLADLGSSVGLSTTAGSGSAVVILSSLTYVDKSTCASVGAVDASGNPSGCTNYTKWVFTQRLTIGNSSIRSSAFGAPFTNPPNGVTVDSSTGKISKQDYVTKSGAVAQFNSINPYASVNGKVSGLPSGQLLYVAEAGSTGFNMSPFVTNASVYSYSLF